MKNFKRSKYILFHVYVIVVLPMLLVLSSANKLLAQCNEQPTWYPNHAPNQPVDPNNNILINSLSPNINNPKLTAGGRVNISVRFTDWDVEKYCQEIMANQSINSSYRIDFMVNNVMLAWFPDAAGNHLANKTIICKKLGSEPNGLIIWVNSTSVLLETSNAWVSADGNITVTATIKDISSDVSLRDPDVVQTWTIQLFDNPCPNNIVRTIPAVEMNAYEDFPGANNDDYKSFTYQLLPSAFYNGLIIYEEFLPWDTIIIEEINQEFFKLGDIKTRYKNQNNLTSMQLALQHIFKIGDPNSFVVTNGDRFTDYHSPTVEGSNIILRKVFKSNIRQNQQGQNQEKYIGFKFQQRFLCGANPIIQDPVNQLATVRKRRFYDNQNQPRRQIFKTHNF